MYLREIGFGHVDQNHNPSTVVLGIFYEVEHAILRSYLHLPAMNKHVTKTKVGYAKIVFVFALILLVIKHVILALISFSTTQDWLMWLSFAPDLLLALSLLYWAMISAQYREQQAESLILPLEKSGEASQSKQENRQTYGTASGSLPKAPFALLIGIIALSFVPFFWWLMAAASFPLLILTWFQSNLARAAAWNPQRHLVLAQIFIGSILSFPVALFAGLYIHLSSIDFDLALYLTHILVGVVAILLGLVIGRSLIPSSESLAETLVYIAAVRKISLISMIVIVLYGIIMRYIFPELGALSFLDGFGG